MLGGAETAGVLRRWTVMSAVVVVVAVAGCGAPGPGNAAASTGTAVASTPTTGSTTSLATSPATPTTAMGRRCGAPDVETELDTVSGPAGLQLHLTSVGRGSTVALLLHQTGRSASCGWWPFANRMADQGIRAVLLDFCSYGLSTCDPAWAGDYTDQVGRTVAWLREQGATRVTLVGASLGGTVASVSATPAHADAVVDLSGFGYGTMSTGPAIAALDIPVLGGGSHSEESDSARLQSEVLASTSPTKRFVWEQTGHGYSLVLDGPMPDAPLTPVGAAVIAWVKGDYFG